MRSLDVVSSWSAGACGAAAAVLLIAACSESHGGNGGPKTSTETGNPPVIDVRHVALVASDGELRVVGEPRAVTPGGGEIEAAAVPFGDAQRAPVEADGSFEIEVDGLPWDTYVLRAIGSGDSGTSAPVYVNRGGADVGERNRGELSCEERLEVIETALTEVVENASRACESNSDCFYWPPVDACPYFLCGGVPTSESGRGAFDTAVMAVQRDLCGPYAEDNCPYPVADCAGPTGIACVDGECTRCPEGECPESSCAQCETPEVSWSGSSSLGGGMTSGPFSVVDCRTFVDGPADNPRCTRELSCTSPPSTSVPGWSVVQLQNALGHPDVVEALSVGASFGLPAPGGFTFTIRVGDDEITILSECADGVANCTNPPPGVQTLRGILQQIAMQQACSPEPQPACAMPFDPGTGSEAIAVYAFHPQTGTCVQQVYTGAGGNENRFEDLASCLAACPPAATQDGCPPNRAFTSDLCLECGTGPGGCGVSSVACAKLCTTAADCADEGMFTTCSNRGVCELLCD